jgi:hypothetical protein
MPHYRVYVLDQHHHVKVAVNFDCANDELAKERFKGLLDRDEGELWRLVARPELGHSPPTPSARSR